MSTPIQHRYDFVYFFDITDGNPNGDPDAGNLPRIDPETNQGLVTDVCLKRKIRNFVAATHGDVPGQRIYIRERGVLNAEHREAYVATGQKPEPKKLPKDEHKAKALTDWMCLNFFDIRTFGAVMTTDVNCGQVRGPLQLTFARSIDPIISAEFAITRCAVTKENEDKEREIGRKFNVPYGLYRCHGFISAHLASETGFSDEDLDLFWQALAQMFDHDRSASRGTMAPQKLIVFKHQSMLGNAPAHKLFERVTVQRKAGVAVARAFSDYDVAINQQGLPPGVELLSLL